MQYSDIPAEQLYLVRSMSFEEFKDLQVSTDGVVFSAQSNEAKGATGQTSAQTLADLGLEGRSQNSRNTVHFCLNALVQDHVNGKFSRQVIAIAPLIANLAPSGPSSFSEIDMAFPYRAGQRTFQGMTFLVSEECAAAARDLPGAPSFQTFTPEEAEAAVAHHLTAMGAPVKEAGWYAWRDSGNAGARHAEVEAFAAALSDHCGHSVPVKAHAASLEHSCEMAMGKTLESSRELFQGRKFYNDQGVDHSHLDRLKLLAMQLRMCDVKHPDTRAYILDILPAMDRLASCAQEFTACLDRFRQGDAGQVDRMFELAPQCFHPGLEQELSSFRESNPIFPPPLPEFSDATAPAG